MLNQIQVFIRSPIIQLFLAAAFFMFVFQLEARLISYAYTFHVGVLIVESILLGGGFALLAYQAFSARVRQWLRANICVLVPAVLIIQLFTFFYTPHFLLMVVTLAAVFGLLFFHIAQYVHLPARVFYGVEVGGSFVGALIYVGVASVLLEETILLIVGVCAGLYLVCGVVRGASRILIGVSIALLILFVWQVSTHSLPELMQCRDATGSYKAPCLDDDGSVPEPTASFPSLKGRTDVYVQHAVGGIRTMTARSAGLYAGTTAHEEEVDALPYNFFDTEVPALGYAEGSVVLNLGASTGANIQSLQKYVADPVITAIEIDATVPEIYRDERFLPYMPDLRTYTWEFAEARSYIEGQESVYNIIVAGVESVNSTSDVYVDESTSLVYTDEAFRTYLNSLAPDGYLLLVQYMPAGSAGDAMTVKMLRTLAQAVGESGSVAEQAILYRSGFSQNPATQQFVTVVYKNGAFSDRDWRAFQGWVDGNTSSAWSGSTNPHAITLLHIPENDIVPAVTYAPFFDPIQRTAIDTAYNTTPVTDEQPFRHLVTTLPFPPISYAFFGIFTALFLLLLGKVTSTVTTPRFERALLLSALFGIATFGLQYLLFYKTAAFLHTSLIFFSVFLVIPLFFSAIGGYLSTLLSRQHLFLASCVAIGAMALLATLDIFASSHLLVFTLIALLFTYAGFLFPLLIHPIPDERDRSILYATNLFAGGIAFLILVTAHATLGWTVAFILTSVLLVGGVGVVSRTIS